MGGRGVLGGEVGWLVGMADGNEVWRRHTLAYEKNTHAEDGHQHTSFTGQFRIHLSDSNKNCSRFNMLSREKSVMLLAGFEVTGSRKSSQRMFVVKSAIFVMSQRSVRGDYSSLGK